MKKEDLMKIEGITEELATQIAEASAEELKGFIPKSRFDEVNDAKKNAESLVKERDKQIEGLKTAGGDAEALKKQIDELQEANKAAKSEYEANIKKVQVDNAVQLALTNAGALNSKAVVALLTGLDKASLDEDGSVKGLKEQIEAIQKSDSYLFKQASEPQKPAGMTPVSTASAPGMVTKEQFSKMGYKERTELFNSNPDLYSTLTSDASTSGDAQ